MATVNMFGSRRIIEPGYYARTIGSQNVIPSPQSFGNVCIIDTGTGASYGGGAGVAGTQANSKETVYAFSDPISFKQFVKGGLFWDLADYLFSPSNNAPGTPLLYYIRAAATAPGTLTYTFTGGGANGGVFTIKTKDEGLVVNGAVAGTVSRVTKGYGAKMFAGVVDTSKFYIEFYVGTYKGNNAVGMPFDGILEADSQPILIARSIEFSNIADLFTWAANDVNFNSAFTINTQTKTGTGAVTTADLTANSSIKLVTGGTETYSGTHLDTVLDVVADLDNSFFFCDKYDSNANGTDNNKILTHLVSGQAEFGKYMIVGGGNNSTTFANTSISTAQSFNSGRAIVVHSGIKWLDQTNQSLKDLPSIYLAALVCGRISGLAPQIPGTYKDLKLRGVTHELTLRERETALQAGVLHVKNISQMGWVINQAINTLQKNTNQITPEGQSFEISLMRISDQLNRELVESGKQYFIGNNLNTTSPEDVRVFTRNFLQSRTATKTQDNLILSFSNITVRVIQDYYEVSYSFVGNGPLNKVFNTSTMLPVNFNS